MVRVTLNLIDGSHGCAPFAKLGEIAGVSVRIADQESLGAPVQAGFGQAPGDTIDTPGRGAEHDYGTTIQIADVPYRAAGFQAIRDTGRQPVGYGSDRPQAARKAGQTREKAAADTTGGGEAPVFQRVAGMPMPATSRVRRSLIRSRI